jgi:hypothetical protein
MAEITNFRPKPGRIAATFSAVVGDLSLSGCALIRRDDGFTLSLPRTGSPSRSAPLNATELAALENAAVEALRAV